eukprot:gene31395-58222_t
MPAGPQAGGREGGTLAKRSTPRMPRRCSRIGAGVAIAAAVVGGRVADGDGGGGQTRLGVGENCARRSKRTKAEAVRH